MAVIPFPPPFRVSVSFWGIWVCALLLLLLLFTNGSSVQIPNAPNLLIEPPNPIKIKSQLNERSFFNTRPENPGWSGGGGSLNMGKSRARIPTLNPIPSWPRPRPIRTWRSRATSTPNFTRTTNPKPKNPKTF